MYTKLQNAEPMIFSIDLSRTIDLSRLNQT